jgi:hypothetical protein
MGFTTGPRGEIPGKIPLVKDNDDNKSTHYEIIPSGDKG